MKQAVFIITLIILLPCALQAATYPAEVVRVVDGDTVILKWEGQQSRVRIIGIDTPEVDGPHTNNECWGQEASQQARRLLSNQTINFEFNNEYDKYDRALGYLTLSDGRDFGSAMIRNGHAYAYRAFDHPKRSAYIQLEDTTRREVRGLWADDACYRAPQSQAQIQQHWAQQLELFERLLRFILSQLI